MDQVKIGWSKREISMNEPISIVGQMYMRISEGIHDPLMTYALCIDGGAGQEAVIFCSLDVVVLRSGIIDKIKRRVAEHNAEIPVENIILNATHTHSSGTLSKTPETSPDGQKIFPGDEFARFVADQACEAICEAWETRKPGGISFGYGFAVVGHSRRSTYFDDLSLRPSKTLDAAPNGHAKMYGNTNDPMFAGYEAGADHFVNLFYTYDENNKLTGMIVNVPCPSQVSEQLTSLSADYWNEVREGVKKEFGEEIYVLPQCAAAGDLAPRLLHYKQAQERRIALKYNLPYDQAKLNLHGTDYLNKTMGERYDIGERILLAVKEVYEWASRDIQKEVPVQHICEVLPLKRRMITKEEKEACEKNIEAMKKFIPDENEGTPEERRVAITRYNSIKSRNERAIARYNTQEEDPTLDMTLHTLRIGECGFSTCRFEYYMDFMTRIQARSPFIQTFVIQLAGDEGGNYLATERAQKNKGYGASLFCNVVSFEGGQQIVEKTLENLHKLKGE